MKRLHTLHRGRWAIVLARPSHTCTLHIHRYGRDTEHWLTIHIPIRPIQWGKRHRPPS